MKLFYREYGKGEILVILHGLFGLSDNWHIIAKILSQKLSMRIIVPDLRNHGKSKHSDKFDYQSMSEDLLKLFSELNIDNASLLGHSMGGKIAMLFAINNQEKTKRVMVVDICPIKYNKNKSNEMIKIISDINIANFQNKKQLESYLANKTKDINLTNLILKNVKTDNKNSLNWKCNTKTIINNIDNILDFEKQSNIFNKDVLFIKGENSDYIKPEHHSSIYHYFPNAKIQTIEKSSHWVHADNPEKFMESIISFIK